MKLNVKVQAGASGHFHRFTMQGTPAADYDALGGQGQGDRAVRLRRGLRVAQS